MKWCYDEVSDQDKFEEKINKISEYIKQIEQELEKNQYTLDLYKSNLISTVRSNTTRWDYMDEIIIKACSEKTNKKKKERTNIDYIADEISKTFLDGQKIKIFDIIQGGHEGYYWLFLFEFRDNKYAIQVPMRKQLSKNNFDYANKGKFVFTLVEGEHYYKQLFSDYHEDKLTEKIINYFS